MSNFNDFENRLAKNYKHIAKWAKKQGITCFRVYDDDIPEFPLAIDLYDNCLHIAEYKRKHTLSDEQYQHWLQQCNDVCLRFFQLEQNRLFVKWRDRQQGIMQYQKFDHSQNTFIIKEHGLNFEVNLSDYLDTGLFLDHRNTRKMVANMANGQHVLNLFAYTGSFSVYAAANGAASTTTIDLSNTYLQWAERNFALNNIKLGKQHQLIQADVLQWLHNSPKMPKYDIIVLDPPTFSNSKRMNSVLDVQRDHALLINQCLLLLKPQGTIFFSTNCRSFQLHTENIATVPELIKNISKQTVPDDFRNKKIHYCFTIQGNDF